MAKQHLVKCLYCGKTLDADKEEYVKPNKLRYAHKACAEAQQSKMNQEEKDKKELETYICDLFSISCISPKIAKQIKIYHDENKYSYSAIRKTLIYFFEIKHNPIDKANEGIGIVPWAVSDAAKYWKSIETAREINQELKIEDCEIPTREVYIVSPHRDPMVRHKPLFTFLNDEVV